MKNGKLLASLLTVSALMVGCNQQETKQEEKVEEIQDSANEEVSTEATLEEETQMRLVEQGFEIEQLHTFENEDVILLELIREGDTYYAMMNGDYEWVLKPTNEIKDMEYNDYHALPEYDLVVYETEKASIIQGGLIALAIQDERPREDDGLLWGYMNTEGEWVIEPQYRSVQQFSDGIAIVETIEEDRDDLQNSRMIAIDKEGNELFEISKSVEGEEIDSDSSISFDVFKNGYLKTSKGVFNKKGELFSLDFIPEFNEVEDGFFNGYEVIKDQVVTVIDSKIKVFSLQGNLVKEFSYPSTEDVQYTNNEISNYDLKLYTNTKLAESGKFVIRSKILNLDGKVVFESDSMRIEDDIIITRSFKGEEAVWNFYDLDGNPITNAANKVGIQLEESFYNDEPHWEKGNEYYKLISPKGEELIGEDRKVSTVLRVGDQIIWGGVTDPSTLEEIDVLINTNTLEFIKEVDL
ncbi:WG repeat-containing protein [Ureibacillus sp. GCM10028918]|uniref:WG repeat-containing protein n=1 Tax=Ureibacillus sp. GCM10028918 TaxID=3273429 RepID=UPI00360E423B